MDPLVSIALEARRFIAELGSPIPPLIAQREACAERIADNSSREVFCLWFDVLTWHLYPARQEPTPGPPRERGIDMATAEAVRAVPMFKTIRALAQHLGFATSTRLHNCMRRDNDFAALVRSKVTKCTTKSSTTAISTAPTSSSAAPARASTT
jgi:hypothetical protein